MDNAIIRKEAVNALTNKELKKDLVTMSNAAKNGKKSSWDYAFALDHIIKGESFKDDFKSVRKFSEFIGSTAGAISQITTAVGYVKRYNLVEVTEKNKPILDTIPCSVYLAYLLGSLDDNEYIEFVNYLTEQGYEDIFSMPVREMKNELKQFRAGDEEEQESTEVEATEVEATEVEVPTKEDIIKTIKDMMEEYNITIEELR